LIFQVPLPGPTFDEHLNINKSPSSPFENVVTVTQLQESVIYVQWYSITRR